MVKDKPNSIRTYDVDGFRRRAACLCVKDNREQEVLLVSGSKNPCRWVVPGGGIEPTEDAGVAAAREVYEEAGVVGTLGRCLGVFENSDRQTRTSVYVLVASELLEEWEDSKTIGRKRKWFQISEAKHQLGLHKPVQQEYVELLVSSFESSECNLQKESSISTSRKNGGGSNGTSSDCCTSSHQNINSCISPINDENTNNSMKNILSSDLIGDNNVP